ncbi:MAG: hypothetical protein MI723_03865, partial [Caulobacterales bacterium]|nr:hypothetical protein [Caulobacterales bacterium]
MPHRRPSAVVAALMLAFAAPAWSAPREQPADVSSFKLTDEYRRGVEALQTGDYDRALELFALVADAVPGDMAVQFAMGLAYAGSGADVQAVGAFRAALALDGALIVARQELARALARLG